MEQPRFICDAMLGALARWLRAAGYQAEWDEHLSESQLVELALQTGRILLTCNSRIMKRNVVRTGELRAILIPHGLDRVSQLEYVARLLQLARREPLCMSCGGRLVEVPREQLAGQVPPRAYAAHQRFFRCSGCGKIYWHGTHWRRISAALEQVCRY